LEARIRSKTYDNKNKNLCQKAQQGPQGPKIAGRKWFVVGVARGRFSPASERQRLRCGAVLLDILPFGAITDEDKNVSWPPEHEILMSMVAFEEAYAHSIRDGIKDKHSLITRNSHKEKRPTLLRVRLRCLDSKLHLNQRPVPFCGIRISGSL
jgi:hypothetical protein